MMDYVVSRRLMSGGKGVQPPAAARNLVETCERLKAGVLTGRVAVVEVLDMATIPHHNVLILDGPACSSSLLKQLILFPVSLRSQARLVSQSFSPPPDHPPDEIAHHSFLHWIESLLFLAHRDL